MAIRGAGVVKTPEGASPLCENCGSLTIPKRGRGGTELKPKAYICRVCAREVKPKLLKQ